MVSLISFLLIGLAAGWLASQLGSGGGGFLKLMVIGVIGSFVGGFLIRLAGFTKNGVIAEIITATAGAIVLIVLLRRFG
ncbi:MAG: GlsB/YeaQ/YmgE family stress response membrane protein [Planctomycetota bacterium]